MDGAHCTCLYIHHIRRATEWNGEPIKMKEKNLKLTLRLFSQYKHTRIHTYTHNTCRQSCAYTSQGNQFNAWNIHTVWYGEYGIIMPYRIRRSPKKIYASKWGTYNLLQTNRCFVCLPCRSHHEDISPKTCYSRILLDFIPVCNGKCTKFYKIWNASNSKIHKKSIVILVFIQSSCNTFMWILLKVLFYSTSCSYWTHP